jgi:hypothetical protein
MLFNFALALLIALCMCSLLTAVAWAEGPKNKPFLERTAFWGPNGLRPNGFLIGIFGILVFIAGFHAMQLGDEAERAAALCNANPEHRSIGHYCVDVKKHAHALQLQKEAEDAFVAARITEGDLKK